MEYYSSNMTLVILKGISKAVVPKYTRVLDAILIYHSMKFTYPLALMIDLAGISSNNYFGFL